MVDDQKVPITSKNGHFIFLSKIQMLASYIIPTYNSIKAWIFTCKVFSKRKIHKEHFTNILCANQRLKNVWIIPTVKKVEKRKMVKPFLSEENSQLVWILFLPRSIQKDRIWFLSFSLEIEVRSKYSGVWSGEMILYIKRKWWWGLGKSCEGECRWWRTKLKVLNFGFRER
jgi:hypothetical protein